MMMPTSFFFSPLMGISALRNLATRPSENHESSAFSWLSLRGSPGRYPSWLQTGPCRPGIKKEANSQDWTLDRPPLLTTHQMPSNHARNPGPQPNNPEQTTPVRPPTEPAPTGAVLWPPIRLAVPDATFVSPPSVRLPIALTNQLHVLRQNYVELEDPPAAMHAQRRYIAGG